MTKNYKFNFYNINELIQIIDETFPNQLTAQKKYDIKYGLRRISKELIIATRDEIENKAQNEKLSALESCELLIKANSFYNSAILLNFERIK